MKKIISGILGLSIASTMAVGLTGCNQTAKGPETLKWICIGEKPADHDLVMAEANKIIEPELGLKLEIEYIDGAAFTEKTKMKMASGEPVDLYFTGYVNNYQTAAQMNGLYDITDMLDNIQMKDGTVAKMTDVIEQYYLDAATIDGKIYGIPNQQVISNPSCISMAKHIAEECGVDLKGIEALATTNVNTETSKALMDKMTEELAKIKAKRPDLYTINPFNPALTNIYDDISSGVAVRSDGSSDELVITAFTDEWKYGVETVRKWFEAGYIRSDIASVAGQAQTTEEQQKYAMSSTTWKPGQEIYYVNTNG